MARKSPGKATTRKKVTRRPAKKKRVVPLKKISIFLGLLALLVFSMGVVGYVIFFRTVIA